MKSIEKIYSKIALPIIGVAGILLILVFVLATKGQSKENNGYIRVINCIISIPATTRAQEDIETCYSTVEKQVGVKLQRYDTSDYSK
jgi:hypothetical protein